jgi:hypothetical protein
MGEARRRMLLNGQTLPNGSTEKLVEQKVQIMPQISGFIDAAHGIILMIAHPQHPLGICLQVEHARKLASDLQKMADHLDQQASGRIIVPGGLTKDEGA